MKNQEQKTNIYIESRNLKTVEKMLGLKTGRTK